MSPNKCEGRPQPGSALSHNDDQRPDQKPEVAPIVPADWQLTCATHGPSAICTDHSACAGAGVGVDCDLHPTYRVPDLPPYPRSAVDAAEIQTHTAHCAVCWIEQLTAARSIAAVSPLFAYAGPPVCGGCFDLVTRDQVAAALAWADETAAMLRAYLRAAA